jgi:hypothetical protein
MHGRVHKNVRVVIGNVGHIERHVPIGGRGANHGFVGGMAMSASGAKRTSW